MQHSEFIQRVGNRMVEYGVEPTREDFAVWLNESDDVSGERRSEIRVMYDQGMALWEMVGKLAEEEALSWWWYIDEMIEEHIG